MSDKIPMSRKGLIQEHVELTKTLKSGNKQALRKEYKEQSRELKGLRGEINRKIR